ncbi:hypothetical protein V9T40_003571 [Parthenolecanium corni]|uniref:Elongation of very long chain fatty acids protein n=1 Tax=Parthenolecanium corni TaxID=536013 RepID=A0AAN9YA92_9HEMI
MAICLTYVLIVKVIGPKFMENRKPYVLRKTLIVYNFLQVLFSMWLFYEAMDSAWMRGYSLRCEPVDYSNTPKAIRVANGCWWYYFSKFTEFFDTFFFVLRKKYDQVTTLHVIHHGIMPLSVWFGVKFTPGGHSTFFGLLNTFVHIIMYAYYMLAAMGPQMQRYLWWKKYLTALQMVQFVLVFVHAFQLLFIECNYPKAFVYWIGMHAVMFYFLFSDFYKQAYIKRQRLIAEKAAAALVANGHSKTAPSKEHEKPVVKEESKEKNIGFSVNWKKMQIPCMLPAVTDDTSSDDDKCSKEAYPKPAGSTPKSSYTSDESSLRNRAFIANKK